MTINPVDGKAQLTPPDVLVNVGDSYMLLTLPNLYRTVEYSLTKGQMYTVISIDESNVTTTCDVAGETAVYWVGCLNHLGWLYLGDMEHRFNLRRREGCLWSSKLPKFGDYSGFSDTSYTKSLRAMQVVLELREKLPRISGVCEAAMLCDDATLQKQLTQHLHLAAEIHEKRLLGGSVVLSIRLLGSSFGHCEIGTDDRVYISYVMLPWDALSKYPTCSEDVLNALQTLVRNDKINDLLNH
jgi:hypothetical protein